MDNIILSDSITADIEVNRNALASLKKSYAEIGEEIQKKEAYIEWLQMQKDAISSKNILANSWSTKASMGFSRTLFTLSRFISLFSSDSSSSLLSAKAWMSESIFWYFFWEITNIILGYMVFQLYSD